MARAGKGKKARIRQLISAMKKPVTGRQKEKAYLLRAALYLAGDRRYEAELKKLDTNALDGERETRWSYYSDLRRRGFALSLFHDLFGNDPAGEGLAAQVGNWLSSEKSSHRYTTQELVWTTTGLGKWVQGSVRPFSTPKLFANGKELAASGPPSKRNDRTYSLARASEYDELDVVVDSAEGDIYALVSSQGVRVDAKPKIGGDGLDVRRAFLDSTGQSLDPKALALGDLVYVQITVQNETRRSLHNLALVDRFAAGFDIENPSLGRGQLPEWVDEEALWSVDHMDIRDDRLEVFGGLKPKEKKQIVYVARAVSAGDFLAPPTEIHGMYEPEVWARDKVGRVVVAGPWAEYID
jgi:hypothetical protein